MRNFTCAELSLAIAFLLSPTIVMAAESSPSIATPVPTIPASTYAPLTMEAGTWDADVTFYADDKPNGTGKGVQVNTLLSNGHWMVNQFTIPADGKYPAYEGHGVWGYDPVAKTYVDTWVDTNDQTVRTDYGFWQEPEQTMVWSSKQSDGKGHFVDYRITEEFKGDTRVFTFYQLGMAKPNLHPLVKIVFTRRKSEVGTAATPAS